MLFNIIKNKIFFIVMLCYICVGFGSLAKAEELISVINIDDSVTLSIQQGNILVTGYALSNNPISEVNIYLDGNFLGKSNFGLERTLPSQYAVYPNYKNSGFSLEFNSRGYSDGEHQLKVESVDVNSTKINKVINIEIKNQRTLIMGQAIATKAQMIKYFQQNNNIKDINYINNFVSILSEEASIEGVRADVSFAQMMKETNFLKFTGDVREFQNNFAGLGATGPVPVDRNVPYGNVFPDIRIGIRAAIQHLKAYASKENLVQAVVDQRFSLVKRESAPYVEWLGIQENPYGGGWASSYNYGYDIVKMVNTLKNLQVNIATATITNFSISGSYYSGKNIMLDANGTATNGILYKFLIGNLDTKQWVTIQDYSEKNTVSWTPIKSGNYQLVVQVKDKLSSKTYDDFDYKNINIQDEPSAKVTNFSISGSYYTGKNITLDANGTATNGILYKFLIGNLDTKQWVTIQDYSEKNTVSWTPIKSGNYQLVVQVKVKLSSKTYDDLDYKNINIQDEPIAKVTNFSISGSYYSGKNIALDANGTATNGILYKFLIGNLDTRQWVTILDYSEKNTVSWTPIKSGNYQLVVQVKDKLSGKAYDDLDYKNINIQDEPSAKVTNFSISGSYYSGENITLVANGTATNGILYKFLIGNLDTKQWVTIQDYSEKNTVSWTPIKSGNYQLVVQVKDKLSSKTYDNFNYKNISVGKTIVLDAGHGGSDPGATGNGYEEADLNIQIVQKLGAKLQALGFNIMYTRQPGTDVYVSLQDRVKFANDNNADLFLSIHHDSSTSSTAQGTSTHYSSFRPAVETAGAYVTLNGKNYSVLKEVDGTIYYMDGSTTKTVSINDATAYDATPSEAAAKSEILAEELVNELSSLGVANRGSSDHNLYVTRWTTMPSVLVEMGFISNPDEIQKIANPSYQDAAAQKIADIIYKFFTNQ